MSPRTWSWSTGFWLLLCIGLGTIVALQLSSPFVLQVTAALPPAALPEPAPAPAPFDPPARHLFSEIAARPLFSETRRPFVPESLPEQAAPEERLAIELVGTLLTEQGWLALLEPKGQSARWLRIGERIAGWQVATIERRQVSLRMEDEAKLLRLRADPIHPAPPRAGAVRPRSETRVATDTRNHAGGEGHQAAPAKDGGTEKADTTGN